VKRALERYGRQFLDYFRSRIKIPKIDCVQRKRSLVRVIAPRAEVTPFQVVVTQLDYDAVPVGGSYWFNGQLQKRYGGAPTPTPETPEPIVEFPTKRAVDMEDAASGLTYQVRFKRILVPTDFSEGTEQALKYAVRFNDLYHAEIFLLHVFTLPEYVSEVADDVLSRPWLSLIIVTEAAKKRALEKLEDIVRRLADKKPALITSLSIGCPFEEIVKFSAERDVDLIVMSTHGRTGLRRILFGGTTERVMSHAACPVLVLPQTGEAK
jgi:nucleotide-binding universal stress UspA family protein